MATRRLTVEETLAVIAAFTRSAWREKTEAQVLAEEQRLKALPLEQIVTKEEAVALKLQAFKNALNDPCDCGVDDEYLNDDPESVPDNVHERFFSVTGDNLLLVLNECDDILDDDILDDPKFMAEIEALNDHD